MLENESEKLDKSFQAYLNQQTTRKIQLNEDITNIWHDYTFGKVLLESRDLTTPRKTLHQTSNTNPKMTDTAAADKEALAQIESAKTFENPFKEFASAKLFPKRRPNSASKSRTQSITTINTIDYNDRRDEQHIESMLQSISSASSYGQLPSPKKNGSNNNIKIPSQANAVVSTAHQKSAPPAYEHSKIVNPQKSETTANEEATIFAPTEDTENRQHINSPNIDVLTSPTISSEESAVDPEPKNILVEIEPATKASNLPLETEEIMATDHDSVTDDELEESLEISIGPKHDASSSEDVWN